METLLVVITFLHSKAFIHASKCRFADDYNATDIINNEQIRDEFISTYLEWEEKFINTPNISIHPILTTTIDGQNLDFINGTVITQLSGSAASKEAMHFMYLALFINDSVSSKNVDLSKQFTIIDTKLSSSDKFNKIFTVVFCGL